MATTRQTETEKDIQKQTEIDRDRQRMNSRWMDEWVSWVWVVGGVLLVGEWVKELG